MTRSAVTALRTALCSAALSLAALGLPVAAAAQGCGPTRLKVAEAVDLDMAPAALWALVGDFQDMSWDPLVAATIGSGGNEAERATRTVTLRDGARFGESLYRYDATAMSYAYHVDVLDPARLPVQNASVTLDVVAAGDGRSRLRWRAAFYRYLKPGEGAPDVADAAAARAMAAHLRSALDALKAKLAPPT